MTSVDICISERGTLLHQKKIMPIRVSYVLFYFHNYNVRGKLKSKGFCENGQMINLDTCVRSESTRVFLEDEK